MARRVQHAMECAICGAAFKAYRSDARTCSPRCKKALQRGVKRVMGADWTAKDVTGHEIWIPRPRRPDPEENQDKRDNLRETWPNGTEVEYQHGSDSPWRPGRVEWVPSMAEVAEVYGCLPLNCGFHRVCLAPHFVRKAGK